MAEIDKLTGLEMIWIIDAISQYKKSRQWFTARIDKGKIRQLPQIGNSRMYLALEDVKREVDKGDD
jgi:hypothetical protein